MDGTPITVTDANMTIPIEVDGFRVFGNKQALLERNDFNTTAIALYPNPSKGIFNISKDTKQVYIYSITGQLVKEFKGDFSNEHQYSVENLNQGMYIVKVIDSEDKEATLKLMKQ